MMIIIEGQTKTNYDLLIVLNLYEISSNSRLLSKSEWGLKFDFFWRQQSWKMNEEVAAKTRWTLAPKKADLSQARAEQDYKGEPDAKANLF